MPVYEYRCQKCGQVIELLIRSKQEEKELRCTQCGASELQRLLSAATVGIQNSRATRRAECERSAPCCGRETRCEQPPCET
jgi:putative FmdB family regulatory protein